MSSKKGPICHILAMFSALALSSSASLAGPKFDDVVQVAPDTYQISRIDHGGIFGNAGKMKTRVMKEAQEFAESKGKVAVVQSIREEPLVVGRSFASIEYTFYVLDQADTDAKRAHLTREPDQVTQEHVKIDIKQDQPTPKTDVYTELLKLDDLRKRGIITEAEFEQQKHKLLSQ